MFVQIYKLHLQKVLKLMILEWPGLTALSSKTPLSSGPKMINLLKQVKIYMRSFS